MDIYKNFLNSRNSKRGNNNNKIRDAMRGLSPKTSDLIFDLSSGEKGKKVDINKRAHIKAVELVSDLLSSFNLPVQPALQYQGIVKKASDDKGNITDGVVRIGVSFRTFLGHKMHIDVPVIVRKSSLLEPAVFYFEQAPYVMCAPALDELVRRGSLSKEMQQRVMFAPPVDGQPTHSDNLPRSNITNVEHMFSPGARNPWTFRRYSSKDPRMDSWRGIDAATAEKMKQLQPEQRDDHVKDWMDLDKKAQMDDPLPNYAVHVPEQEDPIYMTDSLDDARKVSTEENGAWVADSYGRRIAQHLGAPRQRTNIDTPTETPELWQDSIPDEMLDAAERSREGLLEPGTKVRLEKDMQARERGGGHLVIPSGEEGVVLRDMEGDGKMLYVKFDAMGLTTPVPCKMLKSAAVTRRIRASGEPDFIEETYLLRNPRVFGEYFSGGMGTISVPFTMEDGFEDKDHYQGYAYYADNKWLPWSNDEGSEMIAEKLNSEGWVLSMGDDAVPLMENFSWSKSAATEDQVKNEVQQMIREGYTKVDIKEAITRRYPSHSDSALQSLD